MAAVEGVDQALAEWGKVLRSQELAQPGRKLVFETAELEALEKKRPVHVLVCSDTVVVSQVRKKSTFSRRKTEMQMLAPDALTDARPEALLVTLGGEVIKCASKTVFDALVEAILQISDGEQKGEEGGNIPGAPDLVDGVKTDAVFERMTMWASGGGSDEEEKNNKNVVQSIRVFREILDSERTYVEDLRKLMAEYVQPLQEASSGEERLIGAEDLAIIFNNVESIVKINSELLQSLQNGILGVGRNGEIPTLSEVAGVFAREFQRVLQFFKMYSMYCHKYNAALERLCQLRESNRELASFLQRREARKKNQQASLQSLLIKPVQRICKYPLLFRELLNHMTQVGEARQDDADFWQHVKELRHTETSVQVIASDVNEKVSVAENQEQVMRVYLELGGESGCPGLVTPSRRFVRSEDVLMREAPFAENRRQRHRLYLFNDLVIFARGANGTLGKRNGTLGRNTTIGEKLMGSLTPRTKLKVTHNFSLDQCKGVKPLNYVDEDGRSPFELRRVSRVERAAKPASLLSSTTAGLAGAATGAAPAPSGGAARTATHIQRFEVWCDTQDQATDLMGELNRAIEALEMTHETREGAIPAKGKARAWASRAKTRTWRASYSGSTGAGRRSSVGSSSVVSETDTAAAANDDGDDTASVVSISAAEAFPSPTGSPAARPPSASASSPDSASAFPGATASGERVRAASCTSSSPAAPRVAARRHRAAPHPPKEAASSLADLKSKYTAAPLIKPDAANGGTLRLDVEFPEGPLGLALENSKAPMGVLVACVAALSVAERHGLALGDRVIAVGGIPVDEDATWDHVVDMIKSLRRPVTISFERTAETMAAGEARNGRGGGGDGDGGVGTSAIGGPGSSGSLRRGARRSGVGADEAVSAEGGVAERPKSGTRLWAAKVDRRKAAMGTNRLLSLGELEACYKASASAVAPEEGSVEDVLAALEADDVDEATEKPLRKTVSVLREIVTTEKNYVCDLRKLIGEYMLPLRQARRPGSQQPMLDPEDEQAIFLNAEGILRVNAELLRGVVSKLVQAETLTLSDAVSIVTTELVDILPFLKMYAMYCHKYAAALGRLVACRKASPPLEAFLNQREERPENKHSSLQSLLIKPVQRICKYPLLVRALREAVDKLPGADAAIKEKLAAAQASVDSVAAQVNEKVNEAANLDAVVHVFEALSGETGNFNLVEPHRRFVMDADVSVIKAPFYEGKAVKHVLLLFNDLIVLATRRGGAPPPPGQPRPMPAKDSLRFVGCIDLRKSDLKSLGSSGTAGAAQTDKTFQLTQVTRVAAEGSTRVNTSIDKYRVLCEDAKSCETLVSNISREMTELLDKDTTKRASVKRRSWQSRGSAGGNSRLAELESRYNVGAGAMAAED